MLRILILISVLLGLAIFALTLSDSPRCRWRGTAPFCMGSCTAGETPVATATGDHRPGCLFGRKVLCCPAKLCRWRGTAPFCYGACSSRERAELYDKTGPAGSDTCLTGKKALCCTIEPGP